VRREVIPEGALGAVPKAMGTGGLSTYKELCSVANELGQPDLIYRFLNLASHHSLWNSRKGAAFAATALASREGMEYLKPFLPTLVPLLYRSSYDPNPRVAQSMRNILNSITDARKAADEFFEPIMKELLKGLVSNVWRTRESSCYAISDALQSKLYSTPIARTHTHTTQHDTRHDTRARDCGSNVVLQVTWSRS
jgi:proteasome component ECM29